MHQNQTLKDRVAIVTGASAGIGESIAIDLASRGAGVILNARRESRLDELAQRLSDQYGQIEGKPRAIGVPGDASEDTTIDAMLDAAQEHYGKPADLIIANAGRGLNGSVMTSDMSQWEEMIRTNLLGVSKLIRRSGEQLLALKSVMETDGIGSIHEIYDAKPSRNGQHAPQGCPAQAWSIAEVLRGLVLASRGRA